MLIQGIKYKDVYEISENLPDDEIQQIEALSNYKFSPESISEDIMSINGYKFTLTSDNIPIAVGGFYLVSSSVWQTFMLVSNIGWEKSPRVLTRKTKEVIDLFSNKAKSRIQTLCLSSRTRAHRWYNIIGLNKEAVLHSYGNNGEDITVFSKINRR